MMLLALQQVKMKTQCHQDLREMSYTNKISKKLYNQLKKKLNTYSEQYHTYDAPTVSDEEFDRLYSQLKDIETNNPSFIADDSPTQRVGAKVHGGFSKVKHIVPMMSLSNAVNHTDFSSFYKRVNEDAGLMNTKLFAEPKFDGLAICITYQNGEFVSAVTRGDGRVGEDVTSNIKTIKSLPLKLNGTEVPKKLIIVAEVFVFIKDFNMLNKQLEKLDKKTFANPRNFAAGTVRQLDPTICYKRNLQIYIHGIMDIDESYRDSNHSEAMRRLKRFGLNICEYNKKINNESDALEFYNFMNNKRDSLPYEIDGIVYKVDDYALREIIGKTNKAPKWSIAYKFKSLEMRTYLKDVTFQVGRTGIITPVAELNPVNIGGVKVSRASLHNFDEIQKKDICIGDYVFVKRAGDVIPEVDRVDKTKRKNVSKITIPKKCPSCRSSIKRVSTQSIFRCENEYGCMPQIIQSISHFSSRKAMNINGLGESIIISLVENKLIRDYADLFSLKKSDLLKLERMGELSVKNLIESLEKAKEPSFDRFIFALGIREVGETLARIIANEFKDIDSFMEAKLVALEDIKDIGPIVAKNIEDFFRKEKNVIKINRLIENGVNIRYLQKSFNKNFENKSFVITGSFKIFPRKKIEEYIINNGAKLSSTVSKKTDFLVCGDKPGSKYEKAKNLNVKILNEDEFIKLL